ncbi:hypothetical protein FHS18_001767 [Paenibacillus phyllosphaerae]|uniref:Uncharacterized protein n=1 Tax=Paenibacillus phyllosphaerae TaxID=274593 RepID=A0A7W5AWD6_9BACL|nr:hypothetical protein [Paenibacillus phyllosphaerae]MBB3109704.1 hypothetical protein [Paenibacillus phyllosphaerae]
MDKKQRVKQANSLSYMELNNANKGATYPVSVDYTFLHDLFSIEQAYDEDEAKMFRRNSHPVRKFHVTAMSLRLMMTIFRRFNTEGSLVGVSVHRLYKLMNEEYEQPGSKEQFYAEVQKFIELKLISTTRSGIISEWRVESFKRRSGRFVLFHPVVFTKAFTDLPVSAQKLYLYLISRNGDKVRTEFKEFLSEDCWLYTLTHKSRPAQVRELLHQLANLAPHPGQPLLSETKVAKDSLGRWSVVCVPNPAYQVRHEAGRHYRFIPKAKVPYSKTVSRLRMLLHYYKLGEVELMENGRTFLRLVQLLHRSGLKTVRYAAIRLRELMERGHLFAGDPVRVLESELADRAFQSYMDAAKRTGLYAFIGGDESDAFASARPLQFYRTIRGHFSLRSFQSVCKRALPMLQHARDCAAAGAPEEFYLEDFLIERFARA